MQTIDFDPGLIRRLDRPGPRYTSYPTADRFSTPFSPSAYMAHALKRNAGGQHRGLSLYLHIPFCPTLCLYCACNKIVTRDRSRVSRYLGYLMREVAMQGELFHSNKLVEQLHWGGGSPSYLTPGQMHELMRTIRQHFRLTDDVRGDFSIEVDPRYTTPAMVAKLRAIGFNRLSVGVQDFDPAVQKAVNRVQTPEETFAVLEAARREGYKSTNVDLIYGLPLQNVISFNKTLTQVIAHGPDRLAIYNYAHLPHVFKAQRRIDEADLPSAEARLQILQVAVQRLSAAGYEYIGMDHFAKPDDDLAVAQRQGRLRRNFMGYTTHADTDIVGMGVSAISSIGAMYAQNVYTAEEYYERLDGEELPVLRGMELTPDDLLRREVIQGLLCHFLLYIRSIEEAYLIDFRSYFAREIEDLQPLVEAGLLTIDDEWINVTPKGRFLIRNICMVFDRHLRAAPRPGGYSRTI
jgi:oxygen-independent coproporphyrinogen-3 oxidase